MKNTFRGGNGGDKQIMMHELEIFGLFQKHKFFPLFKFFCFSRINTFLFVHAIISFARISPDTPAPMIIMS